MEVDLSRVLAHRAAHQEAFNRQGVRLTLTPYFVMATVAGLQAVPVFNGSFTEQGIIMHRRINIGVAVALNEGLLVPVIPDADEKNLLGLARAVNDLAERARTKRLRPEETQGGTFTITNHGVTGSLFATPIINQPQAGILGIGAVVKRPVVITQNGLDAIAIRPLCYLSFTFDHRIADGATADRFLATVKQRLEQWEGERNISAHSMRRRQGSMEPAVFAWLPPVLTRINSPNRCSNARQLTLAAFEQLYCPFLWRQFSNVFSQLIRALPVDIHLFTITGIAGAPVGR